MAVMISMGALFPASTSPSVRFLGTTFASLNRDTPSSRVQITEGLGRLPKVQLSSVHGRSKDVRPSQVFQTSRLVWNTWLGLTNCEAEIYLFGGCITSWKVANSKDLLFVRPDAVFNGQKPISGGIPHCFPQFGPGPMQQHGFARNMNWAIANFEDAEGDPIITLELRDDPYSRSMWDFAFQALYTIRLSSKSLSTKLVVTNRDKRPFSFNSALHTYFRASAASASVSGLKGCKTLNKDPDPVNPLEGKEVREVITFPGFVDCVYLDAPGELHLDNGLGDGIYIKNKKWSDAVLWNPYLTMEACYKDFVCVENAKIVQVQLQPEQSWVAEQELSTA